MVRLLILNGVHNSGKTTLGESLRNMGYDFQNEMAEILMSGNETIGMMCAKDFQKKVIDCEIERDAEISRCERNAIIETWHIGILAHTYLLGTSEDIKRQENYIRNFLNSGNAVHAVFLMTHSKAIDERNTGRRIKVYDSITPEILDFYTCIQEKIFSIYDKFSIRNTTIDNESINYRIATVAKILDNHGISKIANYPNIE